MVIGHGMIGSRFKDYLHNDNFLVFASGVSNSELNDQHEFDREQHLLESAIKQSPDKTIAYFSTCSIYDSSLLQSRYVKHKLKMEEIIRRSEKHTIFRVSNPIGITSNVHTILNYLIQHIIQKKSFTLWKYATRNVVDIDHMYSICDYILQNGLFINQVVNVANPVNYPVIEIVDAIEKHFKVDGIYDIEPKSSSPVIDVSPIQALFDKLDISFTADYLENLLTKYYPQSWLTEK